MELYQQIGVPVAVFDRYWLHKLEGQDGEDVQECADDEEDVGVGDVCTGEGMCTSCGCTSGRRNGDVRCVQVACAEEGGQRVLVRASRSGSDREVLIEDGQGVRSAGSAMKNASYIFGWRAVMDVLIAALCAYMLVERWL